MSNKVRYSEAFFSHNLPVPQCLHFPKEGWVNLSCSKNFVRFKIPVPSVKIRYSSSRFFYQQDPCGNIPQVQIKFEIGVSTTRSDMHKIDGRCAGRTDTMAMGKQLSYQLEIIFILPGKTVWKTRNKKSFSSSVVSDTRSFLSPHQAPFPFTAWYTASSCNR